MASHFNDHRLDESDIRDLLKKITTNIKNARTRFVRTIPAVRGAMLETENEDIYRGFEKVLAHLCFIVDAIDGEVLPDDDDELLQLSKKLRENSDD